jgi:hypothetical protein
MINKTDKRGNPYTYEEVKTHIEKEGYRLLSKEYIRGDKHLDIECPKGHVYKASYHSFNSGSRCGRCKSDLKKLSIDTVREIAASKGYQLVSTTYINCKTKMEFICSKGHHFNMFPFFLRRSKYCPICFINEGYTHDRPAKYDYVKNWYASKGYRLISDSYSRCDLPLTIQCDKGHEFKSTFSNSRYHKLSCPVCHQKRSVGEIEMKEYIQSIYSGVVEYTYKLKGCRKNLDVYLPEVRLGFEYQGIFYHMDPRRFKAEDFNKKTGITAKETWEKDFNKVRLCEEQGIKLYPVWEWDWEKHNAAEKTRIKSVIESTNNRLEEVVV